MQKFIITLRGILFYNLGFLENRFYWKTRKFLKKHYISNAKTPTMQNKMLVYMLDGRAYSGGISDILKGIISMFKLSKDMGFDFRINFCFPFNLEDYFEPNKYDWRISKTDLSYNSQYSIPIWLYSAYSVNGKSLGYEIEYQNKILQKFFKNNKSKQQFHIYTNSDWIHGYEYSSLFHELFKPSIPVQKVLSFYEGKLGNQYISMTLRFQQLLGDFVEPRDGVDHTKEVIDRLRRFNVIGEQGLPDFGEIQLRALLGDFKSKKISVPLSEEKANVLINKCIKKICELHESSNPKMKILITADSETFLSQVTKLDFVCTISRNNTSSENTANELFQIFLKSFIDILMLSEAKKLYLLCADSMYRSAFARNASYINNREYKEIHF